MSPLSRSTLGSVFVALTLACGLVSCAPRSGPARTTAVWLAGRTCPRFDPDGPADALRWAIERHLSRGLLERDSSGALTLALADSIACSADSLEYTFRLRPGLRFSDGSPAGSAEVRAALVGGLGREDHATRAWVLAAVRGVSEVRAGRPLPVLGIETPDPRTLVLKLRQPDRQLLEKLAIPGVSTPWKQRAGAWRQAMGVGPYHIVAGEGVRVLTLVADSPGSGLVRADTLKLRFANGAPHARAALREGRVDLVWPIPPGLLAQTLPAGWSLFQAAAWPARRLLLILRADLPPLTQADARAALAQAVNRQELLDVLGERAEPLHRWLPGAREDYEWPRLESPSERTERLAVGRLEAARPGARRAPGWRRSFHVTLGYDGDLSGAEIARTLQAEWARAGLDAELSLRRGSAADSVALRAVAPQALLVEAQAPVPGLEAELAQLVMPIRGPAIGTYRTGWRTRDYDRWLRGGRNAPGLDPDAIQGVLAEDRIILPISALPWLMAIRIAGPRPVVHVAYGPDWTALNSPLLTARSR